MSRTNKLSFYASDADKSRLEREAEKAGMTASSYVIRTLHEKWNTDDSEEVARQTRVEERVERVASQATDDIAEMVEQQQKRTEQMADMAARSAVYSIANFELLKLTQQPPEAARTKSLQIGSRRLRDPFDPDADANVDLVIEDDSASEKSDEDDEDEFTSSLDEEFFDEYS